MQIANVQILKTQKKALTFYSQSLNLLFTMPYKVSFIDFQLLPYVALAKSRSRFFVFVFSVFDSITII